MLHPFSDIRTHLSDIASFPQDSERQVRAEHAVYSDRSWPRSERLASRDAIITGHIGLVPALALRHRHLPLPLADLVAEGYLGLIRTVLFYKPERVGFGAIATASIRSAILTASAGVPLVRVPWTAFWDALRAEPDPTRSGARLRSAQQATAPLMS